MARSTSGSLRGVAARDTDRHEIVRTDQDRNIARLRKQIKNIMGESSYKEFHMGIPIPIYFNNDSYEKHLEEKLKELEEAND